jgi:hypothetical protein
MRPTLAKRIDPFPANPNSLSSFFGIKNLIFIASLFSE